ncbi:unnamed protein product [Urochloa decumbens]|uniref:F-box protein n=1 Tax=Urochloa decumbens TaxID=240449 RepID=A0ABC8YFB9_9POAL
MTHRDRRLCISGAPAHPLEDTNILPEILLRLPPLPSSLFRASPVCKRYGGVVSDPHFHRASALTTRRPLSSVSSSSITMKTLVSGPALSPPNRIPAARFSQQLEHGSMILGCRHGRVLVLNELKQHFVVWDPITGDHRNVAFPPEYRENKVLPMNGAVLCADRENGHVHGACISESFKGNPRLAIMDVRDAYDYYSFQGEGSQFLIMPADGGSLSFVVLDGFTVHAWNKITNCDDVPTRWVLENSVELIDLLSLKPRDDTTKSQVPLVRVLGVDEDDMVMFKLTESGVVYMVHLETLQFKELP